MVAYRRRQFVAIEYEALSAGLSLEALGLLAYVTDEYDTDALQYRFPQYDVDALVAELLGAGLVLPADAPVPAAPRASSTPVVPRPTFVYVVEASGIFKIGVTANLASRLKHLRTHAPFPPTLIWLKAFPNAVAIEQRLHSELSGYRTHGEWFACDRSVIDASLAPLGITEDRK